MKERKLFNFASLFKSLKSMATNRKISNELFLRYFIEGYVSCGNLTDRNGNPYDFDKTRTSRLINNKDDLPSSFRNALEIDGLEKQLANEMGYFIEYILDSKQEEKTRKNLTLLINNASNIDENLKAYMLEDLPFPLFLARVLIEAIKINNVVEPESRRIWGNAHNSFSIICSDITDYGFSRRRKEKCVVAIPVDTTFETHVSTLISKEMYPLVSEMTLHGKWVIAWKNGGNRVEDLQCEIEKSLNEQALKKEKRDLLDQVRGYRYKIGTIAIVERNNTAFYLVAISEFDEKNVAHSTKDCIETSIEGLLKMYNQNGQGYPLYIPLIGVGRSRTGMSNIEAWHLMRDTIIRNSEYIQGSVNIVLLPDAYSEVVNEIDGEC